MNNLKSIIKSNETNVSRLCRQVNLSRQSMYDIMEDKQIPTVYNALRIAKALNHKIEDIWTINDEIENA